MMRVAMDQAQGDMGASGDCSNIDGDLRLEALELIEEARVDLRISTYQTKRESTWSLLM
jgi:hypothetical protein